MPENNMEKLPQGVYGSENKLWEKQADNIPQSVKIIRGITNQLTEDELQARKELAQGEMVNRLYGRPETLYNDFIVHAETPKELFRGLRGLEKQLEDGNIPSDLSERWTPPRDLAAMYERADLLKIPVQEMIDEGWISKYNPETGEAVIKRKTFAAAAIRVEEDVVIDEKNGYARNIQRCYFGRSSENNNGKDERAELAKAYEKAVIELEVRSIMGAHIGVRLNLDLRDNLENLTGLMHSGKLPYFKADHLQTLFNMPGLEEIEKNPENHLLGDQLEEALFLNLIMLNSSNKERMKKFLEKPGAEHLISKMAKEEDERRNTNYSRDQWIKENIGDVDAWEDDCDRDLEKTWRKEKEDGRRGFLTEWGNISAWAGNPGEFGFDDETKFIEKTIGGLVGSVEASWLAATLMRDLGAYASEGYATITKTNGKTETLLPLGESRFISGDDTGKFYAYMFNMKEGLKGRASGLKDMIGRIPDMAMNLFDWAQIKMDDLPLNSKDNTKQTRSVWDAWLGTKEGMPKIDLLTGQPSTGASPTVKEKYHRLGDLNFASLDREFHGTFTVMQWLMGNREAPTGIFIDALKTDFKYEDFSLNELKKKNKYAGIVMNEVVLTKGSMHLYDKPEDSKKVILKNFMSNLISARIHSASFAQNILSQSVPIFNPNKLGPLILNIPAINLIELFVDKVLKDAPTNEEELIKHYVDENSKYRTLNIDQDKVTRSNAFINAKFIDKVGKVTGRK